MLYVSRVAAWPVSHCGANPSLALGRGRLLLLRHFGERCEVLLALRLELLGFREHLLLLLFFGIRSQRLEGGQLVNHGIQKVTQDADALGQGIRVLAVGFQFGTGFSRLAEGPITFSQVFSRF